MSIPNFVELPPVTPSEEIERLQAALKQGSLSPDAVRLLQDRMALLVRLQLAELALYRCVTLSVDMAAEITAGSKRRSGPPTPDGIANMHVRFVRDYVVPVMKAVREATGYVEGSEHEGRYMLAEDVRAKLTGNERAKARLEAEGRSGLPG